MKCSFGLDGSPTSAPRSLRSRLDVAVVIAAERVGEHAFVIAALLGRELAQHAMQAPRVDRLLDVAVGGVALQHVVGDLARIDDRRRDHDARLARAGGCA